MHSTTLCFFPVNTSIVDTKHEYCFHFPSGRLSSSCHSSFEKLDGQYGIIIAKSLLGSLSMAPGVGRSDIEEVRIQVLISWSKRGMTEQSPKENARKIISCPNLVIEKKNR